MAERALPGIYRREGLTAPYEVGEFWDRSAQIDVVGLRQDGWTDLGECKWGQLRSAKAPLRELEAAARAFPMLFSRLRPRSGGAGAASYSLEDLYPLPPPV